MKTVLFVILLFSAGLHASDDLVVYVSPGVRLGWDFGKGLTFGGKISLGLLRDSDFDRSKFFKLTVGFKAPLTNKDAFFYKEYNFIQVQFGFLPIEQKPLFMGGGLGLMIQHHDPETKLSPMLTFSVGSILFAELDIIFRCGRIFSRDLGALAILPIPFSGFDFGL